MVNFYGRTRLNSKASISTTALAKRSRVTRRLWQVVGEGGVARLRP